MKKLKLTKIKVNKGINVKGIKGIGYANDAATYADFFRPFYNPKVEKVLDFITYTYIFSDIFVKGNLKY